MSSLNLHQQIGGIFCDLSKTFDCVNHEILIAKLHYYGICRVALKWFKSYITNRKQKVKITLQNGKKDSSSRWETIKNGVPQGSILGPLLFIIYVNDFPRGINQFANPVICADDTSVLVSAQNLENLKLKLDFTLHYISDWFSFNGLTLNIDKTKIIKFSSNYLQNQIHQGDSINNVIKEVANINFLGLELDNHISWKNHVLKILPKLNRACYAVRAMYPISGMNTLKMILLIFIR